VKFGEAMAILTGDALLTRAFEVLAEMPEKAVAARLVGELAVAAGPAGMIAGQVADMALCDVPDGEAGRRYIHLRKTAALIQSAVRMGAICAGASDDALVALTRYAERIGLAFQIADDLLDATKNAAVLGKTPGKDAEAGKRTYATELGLDAARRQLQEVTAEARKALDFEGLRAAELSLLADLLARRDR
jgi:geranylgeranyl pyrophosphate synthase